MTTLRTSARCSTPLLRQRGFSASVPRRSTGRFARTPSPLSGRTVRVPADRAGHARCVPTAHHVPGDQHRDGVVLDRRALLAAYSLTRALTVTTLDTPRRRGRRRVGRVGVGSVSRPTHPADRATMGGVAPGPDDVARAAGDSAGRADHRAVWRSQLASVVAEPLADSPVQPREPEAQDSYRPNILSRLSRTCPERGGSS